MATIKSTLALEDKMTPTLSKGEKQALANIKMYNQLNNTLKQIDKALDDLEKTGRANSEMARQLNASWDSVHRTMDEVTDGTRSASISTESLGNSEESLNVSTINLNQSLDLLSKVWDGLNWVMQKSNELMELNNKQFNAQYTAAVKMQNMMGASSDDINSIYEYASALQQTSIMGDEAIISAAGILSMAASNTDSLKKLTTAAVYATEGLHGLDASQSNLESTANSLERAIDTGASQLVRQKILTQSQAQYIDELNDRQEKEAELARIVTENFSTANDMLVNTSQGGMAQANNSLGDLGETLGEKVTPYFAAFEQLLVELLTPAVQWLADNMNWIAPIFITVAGAVAILTAAMSAYQIANWLAAASELAVLWPLALILGLLAAYVYMLYEIISGVRAAQNQTTSAIGVVLGLLFMFVGNIYNQVILPLRNGFASLVNFFANVWAHPIESVEIMFIDFGNRILGILQTIANTIDSIFGTNLSSIVSGFQSSMNSVRAGIIEASGYNEIMDIWENWDSREMFAKGYDIGESVESAFNKAINIEPASYEGNIDFSKFNDTLGKDSTGGSAVKTTTKDDLSLKDEDIQLLLDVATRDYKLNYQKVEPNITITFGDVRETADVDDVMDKIADKLEEIYDSNLEVVRQ